MPASKMVEKESGRENKNTLGPGRDMLSFSLQILCDLFSWFVSGTGELNGIDIYN